MRKILTVCRAGLVRSVALANVLKLHFQPVDVLPIGIGDHKLGKMNTIETQGMLMSWADFIIVMESRYKAEIPETYRKKVLICEVGPDIYGAPNHPKLIDKVFRWVRENQHALGISEHTEML